MTELTIEDLYEIEPQLETITYWCNRFRGNNHFSHCNAYETGKAEAWSLVGWGAKKRILRNCQAYDVFIDELAKVTDM